MNMSTLQQTARLDIRLDPERKGLIEQAARLFGQSVSAFTVSSAVREAHRVVEQFGSLTLSDADRTAFLEALDSPPKANARLKRAFKNHTKSVKS
jgi:uncharacterized protein (DUF1778 family)